MSNTKRISVNLQDLLIHTKRNANNCLEWQRYKDKDGYGKWRVNGEKRNVHRLVCALVYGEPVDNQQALHSCDNPPCINPDHLRWGTHRDNNDDKILRLRLAGERSPSAIYTDAQVRQIKQMIADGVKGHVIYRQFNMSKYTFSNIKNNKNWKHIDLS